MHISDGVLPVSVTLATYAIAASAAAWSARNTNPESIPKTAVMTSAFFVASLVHVPLGPTSVHLLLPGLVGIMLGPSAFISILLGLFLQSILFQYGGLTALGANTVMMGFPALLAGWIFRLARGAGIKRHILAGAFSGAIATALATIILALLLISAGEDFVAVAKLAFAAHLPVICVEAIISGFTVSFLFKVRPAFLNHNNASPRKSP